MENQIKPRTAYDSSQQDMERESQNTKMRMRMRMRMPRPDDSLHWGKHKSQSMLVKDAGVISSALSSLQNFTKDGSFTRQIFRSQKGADSYIDISKSEAASAYIKPTNSANQLAAKIMQLRMEGKHEDAEKLLVKTSPVINNNQSFGNSVVPAK